MTLLEDLNKLKSLWRPLPFSLPTVSLTERLHADIEASPLRPPKPPVDLRVVHNKLLTAKAGGNWGAIQPVEWRYASECLALGQPPLFQATIPPARSAVDSHQPVRGVSTTTGAAKAMRGHSSLTLRL